MSDQPVWVPRRDWYNGRDNRQTAADGEESRARPCYTRHEPAPGVHQDIPHLDTQCMQPTKRG